MIHKIYMHKQDIYEYIMFTIASVVMVIGIYFFKFPNHFSFGGVSGLSIVLSALVTHTPGYINLIINLVLLVLGFIVFGKKFGVKTTYITLLVSFGPSICEKLWPMDGPLTTQPVLELMFAIALPAFSSAIFFNLASV